MTLSMCNTFVYSLITLLLQWIHYNEYYTEEKDSGKTIIDQYFTKTRFTQKQSGHRLWINIDSRTRRYNYHLTLKNQKHIKRNNQHQTQTQYNLHRAWNNRLHTPTFVLHQKQWPDDNPTNHHYNLGTKEVKCLFCGKVFSQYINGTDIQTLAATPS
eukprot:6229207-Amphidinium_carterae.1